MVKIPKKQLGIGDIKIDSLAKRYINQVLASNQLSYGPYSVKFEKEIARFHNCETY